MSRHHDQRSASFFHIELSADMNSSEQVKENNEGGGEPQTLLILNLNNGII